MVGDYTSSDASKDVGLKKSSGPSNPLGRIKMSKTVDVSKENKINK